MFESREKGTEKEEKEKATKENADRNALHHTQRCTPNSYKAPFTTSCLETNSRLLSNYDCNSACGELESECAKILRLLFPRGEILHANKEFFLQIKKQMRRVGYNLKFLLTRKDLNLGYTEITRRHFGTNLVSLRSD